MQEGHLYAEHGKVHMLLDSFQPVWMEQLALVAVQHHHVTPNASVARIEMRPTLTYTTA